VKDCPVPLGADLLIAIRFSLLKLPFNDAIRSALWLL
jgi:hypothetical protein